MFSQKDSPGYLPPSSPAILSQGCYPNPAHAQNSTAYGEDDVVIDVKLWAERRACSKISCPPTLCGLPVGHQ